jgi:hypothetical protein
MGEKGDYKHAASAAPAGASAAPAGTAVTNQHHLSFLTKPRQCPRGTAM